MIIKTESKALLPLIEKAWEQVKGGGDPIFEACHVDHKSQLVYKAESIAAGNAADADDFSQAFKKLFDASKAPAAEKKATLDEKPKGKK